MGWCSATEIFDQIVGPLVDDKKPLKPKKIIEQLIVALEDGDWDCQKDSEYWDHPVVAEIFKKLHPEWFADEKGPWPE